MCLAVQQLSLPETRGMTTWSYSRIPERLQSCCHIKQCDENLLPQCSLQSSPTKKKYEELKASLTKKDRLSYQSVTWQHKLSLTQKHQFYISVTTEAWGMSPLQVIFLVVLVHIDFFTDGLHFSLFLKSYQQKCTYNFSTHKRNHYKNVTGNQYKNAELERLRSLCS